MLGITRKVSGVASMQQRLRTVRASLGGAPNTVNVRVRPARADGADNTEIVRAFKTGRYGRHGVVGARDFWEITAANARRFRMQIDVQYARRLARWRPGEPVPDKRAVLEKIGQAMLRGIHSRIGSARPKPTEAGLTSPFPDLTARYKERKGGRKRRALRGVRIARAFAGLATRGGGATPYPVGLLSGELLRAHYVEVK